MEDFEKCAKAQKQKQYIVPCYLWLAIGAPYGQDITPYGSKPFFLKNDCPFKLFFLYIFISYGSVHILEH